MRLYVLQEHFTIKKQMNAPHVKKDIFLMEVPIFAKYALLEHIQIKIKLNV